MSFMFVCTFMSAKVVQKEQICNEKLHKTTINVKCVLILNDDSKAE